MRYRGALLATLLLSLLGACATQPPQAPEIGKGEFAALPAYLERLITHEMDHNEITGLSIALVGRGETLWADGFGYADTDAQTTVTATTLFRAGSVSKLVNAIKVMQLVERGQLALDEDIRTYLPEFHINSRFSETPKITLRQLLSHQSGLPSDKAGGMWTHEAPAPFAEVLEYLASNYLAAPPGATYSYSNLGFDVIGQIIANIDGTDYPTAMQSTLAQLGMKSSAFSASPDSPPSAQGYRHGQPRAELSLRDVPAGGLTSSVRDLAALIELFTRQSEPERGPLTSQSRATLLQDHTSAQAFNIGTRAGLGIFHYRGELHPSLELYLHNGATHSHRALVMFSPKHQYGVALLSNSQNAGPVLQRLAEKSIELLHRASEGAAPKKITATWPGHAEPNNTQPETMVGHYATPLGLAEFYRHKGELRCAFAGKVFDTFQRTDNGPHYLSYKLFGLLPIDLGQIGRVGFSTRRVNGKTLLIGTDTLGHHRYAGVQVTPSPLSPAWRARLGHYELTSDFPVATVKSGGLTEKDGLLLAHAELATGEKLQYVLEPISDTQAITAGMGRSLGETVFATDTADGTAFEFSGLRFKKLEQ